MKATEYTIFHNTKEDFFGDVEYGIKTKREALRKANEYKNQGCTSVWIDIHLEDDIVGDIRIV